MLQAVKTYIMVTSDAFDLLRRQFENRTSSDGFPPQACRVAGTTSCLEYS